VKVTKNDVQFLQNDRIFLDFCCNDLNNIMKRIVSLFFSFNNQIALLFREEYSKKFKDAVKVIEDLYEKCGTTIIKKDNVIKFLGCLIKSLVKGEMPDILKNIPYERKNIIQEMQNLRKVPNNTVKIICEKLCLSRSKYYQLLFKFHHNLLTNHNIYNTRIKHIYISNEILSYVKELLDNPKFSITVPEIRTRVFENFSKRIPISTLRYHIKNTLKYSYKRTRFKGILSITPVNKIIEFKTLNSIIEYIEKKSTIIFLDESSIENSIFRKFSFSPVGLHSYKVTNRSEKKINIIMGVTRDSILCYQLYKSNANEHIFMNFIIAMAKKLLHISKGNNFKESFAFLIDCASFHESKMCHKLFNILPFDIIYNVPYSPQYNLIESVFGLIKYKIKQKSYSSL